MFLLGLSGCGYKAAPYVLEKSPQSDDNVDFIINKQTKDSNQTVE
jgi:hypothetical protein